MNSCVHLTTKTTINLDEEEEKERKREKSIFKANEIYI